MRERAFGRQPDLFCANRQPWGLEARSVHAWSRHADNEVVCKERFYLDRANPDILHDEITTIDHALTRPWTVVKNYRRVRDNVIWFQNVCEEDNQHFRIGKDDYFIGADGLIWPV